MAPSIVEKCHFRYQLRVSFSNFSTEKVQIRKFIRSLFWQLKCRKKCLLKCLIESWLTQYRKTGEKQILHGIIDVFNPFPCEINIECANDQATLKHAPENARVPAHGVLVSRLQVQKVALRGPDDGGANTQNGRRRVHEQRRWVQIHHNVEQVRKGRDELELLFVGILEFGTLGQFRFQKDLIQKNRLKYSPTYHCGLMTK